MKAKVVSKVTIAAPPEEVFKYLTHLKYAHLWNPNITAISSRQVLKQHSTYTTVSQVLGVTVTANNLVTRLRPAQELEIENNTGTVHYVVRYSLVPKPAGSVTVNCSTEVSSTNKAFAFSGPVLKLLARRELQTDLQALKLAVENHLS